MEKENKVKKFFKENREEIAIVAAMAIGAVVGVTSMYFCAKDSIELGNKMKKYGLSNEGEGMIPVLSNYLNKSCRVLNMTGTDEQMASATNHLIEKKDILPDEKLTGVFMFAGKK